MSDDPVLDRLLADDPPELRDDPAYRQMVRNSFRYSHESLSCRIEELALRIDAVGGPAAVAVQDQLQSTKAKLEALRRRVERQRDRFLFGGP